MLPGKPVSDFSLTSFINGEKEEIFHLSDHKGKYVVLIFYPVDFGHVTPTEFYELEHLMEEFKKVNCEVVAITTEHINRY